MEFPSNDMVMAMIRQHCAALGMERVEQVESALLGQGEANRNILVTVNQAYRFNLRIGLRNEESLRTLQSEFAMLRAIPAEIGPRAFAADLSRANFSHPYIVLEYIDGAVKANWDTDDFQAHARTLARLHQRKFDRHGAINQLTDAPYDFLHRFDVALHYWQNNFSYLLDIPVVRRLIPPIRHFVAAHNTLFTNLRRFTVMHGDAHPLNILFQNDRVRYIDWEWAEIGDPACDLAMLGWDVATAWQIELTGERRDRFLDAYLVLEPDHALRQRRDVWMVFKMCFDQMYHRTQLANDPTGKQAYTVQQIEAYLTHRFL
jgi:aminoglycoside phosphotransferase (APT) family kinase protein